MIHFFTLKIGLIVNGIGAILLFIGSDKISNIVLKFFNTVESIYGSYGQGDFRFTTPKGKTLYAIFIKWPENGQSNILSFNTALGKVKKVSMLVHPGDLVFTPDGQGLKAVFPAEKPCDFAGV